VQCYTVDELHIRDWGNVQGQGQVHDKRDAGSLTDSNTESIRLIGDNGNKISTNDGEFMTVESRMDPVVDTDVPGVKVVTAYLPPAVDVIEPLIRTLSAVGGPVACSAAALTVKMGAWNQSVIGNVPRSIS
jgi:hypothetical protein